MTTNRLSELPGIDRLPDHFKDTKPVYKLEFSYTFKEARLRLHKGGIRTNVYQLIPDQPTRPSEVEVQDWVRVKGFCKEVKG